MTRNLSPNMKSRKGYSRLYAVLPESAGAVRTIGKRRIFGHIIAYTLLVLLNACLLVLLLKPMSLKAEDCIRPKLTFCS